MHRRVQVIDQLRANCRLSENQFHGGERVTRIAVQHIQERIESIPSFEAFLLHGDSTALHKSAECFDRTAQEFPDLPAGLTAFVTREPLRGVREHELVAFLDGFKVLPDLRHTLSFFVRPAGSHGYFYVPSLRVVVRQVEFPPHRAEDHRLCDVELLQTNREVYMHHDKRYESDASQ